MLDLEQIQLLDNNARERYMALEKLFDHPSYKFFIEWAKSEVEDHTMRLITAQTWEQHCFHNGARLAFNTVAEFEKFTELEFSQLAEQGLQGKLEEMEKDLGIEDV